MSTDSTTQAASASSRTPISVIVPTRDRPQLLDGCLAALRATLRPADELIVVDSASHNDRVRDVAVARDATYVRCDRPGASLARNTGWHAARHEIIAFIDDDVRVSVHWADAVSILFDRLPDAAFLTGRVGLGDEEDPEYPVALIDEEDPRWIDVDTQGLLGHSANLAMRRDTLELLGGFDEQLGAGGRFRAAEDQDLFDRAFIAGLRGRYEPSASSTHIQWRRRQETIKLQWAYGVGTGARLAKLLKTDRAMLRRTLIDSLWGWGVRDFLMKEGFRQYFLMFAVAVRLTGMFSGFATAVGRRVRDGHFSVRRAYRGAP